MRIGPFFYIPEACKVFVFAQEFIFLSDLNNEIILWDDFHHNGKK